MTAQEMHVDFRMKMDKLATNSSATYNAAQIDYLLNEAQIVFVRRVVNRYLESTQVKIDSISSIIVNYEPFVPVQVVDLTSVYELPLADLEEDYMYFISGKVIVKENSCTKELPLVFAQNRDITLALKDPFYSSGIDHMLFNIGRGENGSSIFIYTDPIKNQEILNGHITYVKIPSRISVGGYEYIDGTILQPSNCELPEQVHSQIVDLAVMHAASIVEDPQLMQLKSAKFATSE